jgi:hypothetical protein
MKKVLILGAGPAGLFAAEAAEQRGCDVIIVSKARKSFMRGAQYLHRHIPGLNFEVADFEISYELVGTVDEYRDKVYYDTDLRGRDVSVESLVGKHPAWDIRIAYDNAWDKFGEAILDVDIRHGGADIEKLLKWAGADVAISTIPAHLVCKDPAHSFISENIWATDITYGLESRDNVVVCSGERDTAWYRKSKIQGWQNTEYPFNTRPPFSEDRLWQVVKPIMTSCDCFPELHRMGRYGKWEKGVLSDEAYYETRQMIGQMS